MLYPGAGYPGLYFPSFASTSVVLDYFDFDVSLRRDETVIVAVSLRFDICVDVISALTYDLEAER